MIEALDWTHDAGTYFKLTYDEPGDSLLTPEERETQTVVRIKRYLNALQCREPAKEAA